MLTPLQQVQIIEQRMAVERREILTRLDDVDGDGTPDVIVATKDGVEVYRAADLLAGRTLRHPLENPQGGLYRSVDRVADLTGDGRPEILATVRHSGGSADGRTWSIFQWDGKGFRRLFTAGVDNWRGENWLTAEPGRITVTCRPLGHFDHKHMPHRQQREVWVWRDGAFRHESTARPPAPTARQQVSDAERLFYRQDYEAALPLYKQALTLPSEEYDRPDWAPFIHLRLGQIYALMGRPAEATREWQQAKAGGGFVGRAAQVLLEKPLVPALAHLLTWEGEPEQPPPVSLHGRVLAPPQVVLQAYLARGGRPDATDMKAVGIEPYGLVRHDLDGDGVVEIWTRIHGGDFLAARTGWGWRVGELHDWSGGPPVARGRHLQFGEGAENSFTLAWDGRLVHYRWPGAHWSEPLLPEPVERCITRP